MAHYPIRSTTTRSGTARASRPIAALAVLLGALACPLGAQPSRPVGGMITPVPVETTAAPAVLAEAEPSTGATRRAAARAAMVAQRADMEPDLAERLMWNTARNEPSALLRGIKLTAAERTALSAIRSRYLVAFADSRRQERTARHTGRADPSIAAQVRARRQNQRAELREALTPEHQANYDRNAAVLAAGS